MLGMGTIVLGIMGIASWYLALFIKKQVRIYNDQVARDKKNAELYFKATRYFYKFYEDDEIEKLLRGD